MRVLKKDIWPYQVILPQMDVAPGFVATESNCPGTWCRVNIGKRFRDWYSYFQANGTIIYAFKDGETATVFKLKWSGKND